MFIKADDFFNAIISQNLREKTDNRSTTSNLYNLLAIRNGFLMLFSWRKSKKTMQIKTRKKRK